MSVPSGDANNYLAGGSACSYGQLGAYNNGYSLGVAPVGRVSSGRYVTPVWSPISYDSLTSKVPSCSGFATVTSAYGENAGNCQTTYRTSLCGNNQ